MRLRTSLLALSSLLLVACGDSGTEPAEGSLVIPAAVGLPEGVAAALQVTGPGGFTRAVGAPDSLGALPAGTYTVTAASVVGEGARYGATPAQQQVQVGGGARARAREIAYSVTSARLAVEVLGLPMGATPVVTVTGADGFTSPVTATTTLGMLDPGTYTITAGSVVAGGRTWLPASTTTTVAVSAGATGAATVDYGAGTATLAVSVDGVPTGSAAAVTVTGPAGYVRTLGASTTLRNLDSGTYTVAPATVVGSLVTLTPTTAAQSRTLADGGSATASVSYAATALDLGVELVVDGLTAPVLVTAPPEDSRLFVVERNGRVRIVAGGVLRTTPFLDIRDRVQFVGERGMLGMAFAPDYATSGRLYVYYVALDGAVVVERFESTPGADVAGASGGIVIRIPHGGSEHHGGTLAFGPDGMLYLAPGDGRCCGDPNDNAQNTQRLLGKVLRIDVRGTSTYTVPAGNPFVGTSGLPEIWALGLRSPWRFAFDAPTGLLYLADVGQDAQEEINVVRATATARNYGWPIMEGSACYRPSSGCGTTGFTLPALTYSHQDGCSVTGGYVYRGTRIPELAGHYLYADYCRGWLRSFRYVDGAAAERRQWAGVTVPLALSFGQDGAGELYLISGQGRVWRIVRK